MKNEMQFKSFLESQNKDIFGTTRNFNSCRGIPAKEDKEPVKMIDVNYLMSLIKKNKLGSKPIVSEYPDTIKWGRGDVGTIELDISPIGSSKAIINKLHKDLTGQDIWLCQDVIVFHACKDAGKEDALADKIINSLKKVDKRQLEKLSNNYTDFEKLAYELHRDFKRSLPQWFMDSRLNKVSNNYYRIDFDLTGSGNATGDYRVQKFVVNINYYKQHGYIRIFGNEVNSNLSGSEWLQQPMDWNVFYATGQKDEIADITTKLLNSY